MTCDFCKIALMTTVVSHKSDFFKKKITQRLIVVEHHNHDQYFGLIHNENELDCLQTINRVNKNVPLVLVYERRKLDYHRRTRISWIASKFWPYNGLQRTTLNKLSLIKSYIIFSGILSNSRETRG